MVDIPKGFELVDPGVPEGFELVSTPGLQAPLGVQPTAGGALPLPPTIQPEPEGTALGRIGEALAAPFGETQFGLPEQAVQAFQTPGGALNTFNDLVVRGIASPAFSILQGLGAGAEGVIDALAQTAVETGAISDQQAKTASDDIKGLLEVTPAFAGTAPLAPLTARGAARRATADVPEATPGLVQETRDLPVGVPVTRGDITGDVNIQRFEDQALKGLHGPVAQQRIQALRQEQDEGFRSSVEELQKQITGRPAAAVQEETGAGAGRALQGVRAQAEQRKVEITTAYDEALSLDASIEADLIEDFTTFVRGDLIEQGFDVEDMPKLTRRLAELDKIGKNPRLTPATVNQIELLRKRMVKSEQSLKTSDPSESAAIGSLRRNLDQEMSDLLDEGLIQGNEDAVRAWKTARDLRADFGRRFDDSKVISRILDEDLTQEQAINLIFGGSQMGFRNDAGATIKRMKDILGPGSDEFRSLKEEAVLRLVKNQKGATFSGVKLDNAIKKAMVESPTVMRELFSAEEIDTIRQIGRTARQVTEKNPGAVNTSNTFNAALAAKRRAFQKFPVVGEFISDIWKGFDDRKAAGRITDNITLQQDLQKFRGNPELFRRALETAVLIQDNGDQ